LKPKDIGFEIAILGFVLDVLIQNLHIVHAFDIKVFVGLGGHLKGG